MADNPTPRQRLRTILRTAEISQLPLLAAAIAFYGLLSIVPLTVVVIALASVIAGPGVVGPVFAAIDHLVTSEAIEFVESGLEAPAGRSGATVGGVLVAAWGSLRVFRGLDQAFNAIYGRPGHASLVRTFKNALAVLAAVLGVVAALVVGMLGMALLGVRLPVVAIPLLVAPAIAAVFVPMYWVFPPSREPVRRVLPGAAFAGLGVTVATVLVNLYVAIAAPYAIYGVLAGVFVAMTWLYAVAAVVLLGVVLNATQIGRHRHLHADSP